MAKGVINLQKESGGVTKITSTDGTGITELVLPESGELIGSVGNQTIGGVKTFSSSPIIPTPTTGTQAVNKDYADLKVALVSFIGSNQSLSDKGYQKLPGGLIIQWGKTALISVNSSNIVVFPIVFPNSIFSVSLTDSTTAGDLSNSQMSVVDSSISTTGMTVMNAGHNQPGYAFYLVIGY